MAHTSPFPCKRGMPCTRFGAKKKHATKAGPKSSSVGNLVSSVAQETRLGQRG